MADIQYCHEQPEQDFEYVPSLMECPASAAQGEASQKEIDEWIKEVDTRWYPVAPAPSLEERFLHYAQDWQRSTEHLSSPSQMMMHPSYQAIMGMANGNENELIRLMLRDLKEHRRLWFWALSYLTKENPIKQSDAGKMDKMIISWCDWGKSKGIL
jgi:hypothetical protein